MTHPDPTTETMAADGAREAWDALLERVGRQEASVVIERDGKPVAALVSARDLEILELRRRQREEDFKALDRMRAAFADVPEDELEREIQKALSEVRARNRRLALALDG